MKKRSCPATTHQAGSGPACTPVRRSSGHAATTPANAHALFTSQLFTDGPTSCCSRGGRLWMRNRRSPSGSRAARQVNGAANTMNDSMLTSIVATGKSQKSGSR
jgi:hypothetical protein